MDRRRLLLLAGGGLLAAAFMPVPHAAAGGGALGDLLARFARLPGLSAHFREEKHIALLAAPLINEGTLYFAPPGRLVRHTERPARSTLLVEGDRITVGEGGEVRSLELARSPALRVFVEGFVHLLSGDREGLERDFELSFEPGDGERWRLVLRPRAVEVQRMVQRLEARGTGVILDSLEIDEASSDRTVTTFFEVNAHRRFSSSELARLFRVLPR